MICTVGELCGSPRGTGSRPDRSAISNGCLNAWVRAMSVELGDAAAI